VITAEAQATRTGADPVRDLLTELDRLAQATGDPRLRRAANAARWSAAGRLPVDDRAAIAEVRWLIDRGTQKPIALRAVARRLTGYGENEESIVRRLRRKLVNPA
jgi:hypothetical protein